MAAALNLNRMTLNDKEDDDDGSDFDDNVANAEDDDSASGKIKVTI